MKECNCSNCNSPVTIPDGMTETVCSKCNNVIRTDDIRQKQRRRISRPKYQLIILVLLLAVMGGVWAYIGTGDSGGSQSAGVAQPASEWIEYIGGEPRADTTGEIYFNLYEFHADDAVRIVAIFNISGDAGKQRYLGGPWLRSYDALLSVDFINSSLVDQYTLEHDYGGSLYYSYVYIVNVSGSAYGCDTLVDEGYLHVRATDRLLSIGCDPNSYFDQDIVAIAIPQAANITSILDYQPYRHITLDDWDVFYYDVTDITAHVSIHITYVSGEDAPRLDWAEVEASR
jgi:hypothetical protein